jgi:hypothetical protein
VGLGRVLMAYTLDSSIQLHQHLDPSVVQNREAAWA